MLHVLKVCVVDVEDIWGKGNIFMGEIGERTKHGYRMM
jgi:hypothetical protein